jgi:hypothetical protein
LKKNHREIINIIALVIILIAVFGIYNIFNKSIKRGNNFKKNTSSVKLTTTDNNLKEFELDKSNESEETVYDSEKYVDSIVNDSTSSGEEISFSPKVAFIIDDLGYEKEIAEKLVELNFSITLSIFPFVTYSKYIAEEGKKKNKDIMLHLPMEPKNSSLNPGLGAIKANMSEEEIRQDVIECILNIPHIIGVNNHMGSKITEDRKIMKIVLEEIKKYNLFFVDSMTTKDSVAHQVAREMGVKTAVRSVFLDNESDMEYIKGQMLEVQKIALEKGEAIAIGHDRINTFYVLKRMIPELIKAGIEIVPVSELVK